METPQAHHPTANSIEAQVRRIRAALECRQYREALAAAETLRLYVPENRDVLYMSAVAYRYLDRIDEALATLSELERLHPAYGRLYQERGHCYFARRLPEPAIRAYLRALELNQFLPASWKALQTLFKITEQADALAEVNRNFSRIAVLPPAIATACSMFADGEIHDAEALVRQYLLQHGDHVEGMRLLAKIGMQLDILDDAEILLANVMVLAPDYNDARYELALVLLNRYKHKQAREEMRKLLALEPRNRMYRVTQATINAGLGDFHQALAEYRDVLVEIPRDPGLHLSIAHALKTLGATQQAVASYRTAIAYNPRFGEAYWSLANLKTYQFTDIETAQMRREEASPGIDVKDRYHFCFALGKALEDQESYEESFHYYERGNALKKAECRYSAEATERNAGLQISTCTQDFFSKRPGFGSANRDPIFIVGLPRAGSTLVEQILASHSHVDGTMELAIIPRIAQELVGRGGKDMDLMYPDVLSALSPEDCARLGEQYLAESQIYRSGNRFFIDKMPNNFRHLGLIHLILPNAKVIDARRHPMACCFSNFKQLFASGQQFTYSMDDIAHYYRTYVELMAHWDTVLPSKILHVLHEDVVGDLETNVRRILDFCELPYESSCLEFYATNRSIHSASSEQVRRPIYREGLEQWRHFANWLAPLKLALGNLA